MTIVAKASIYYELKNLVFDVFDFKNNVFDFMNTYQKNVCYATTNS